jgi:hypothetical protein
MSATRLLPLAIVGALALPGAAGADPVETNALNTACNASVWVGQGSFQHGAYQVTTPEQTIRLADHTGTLGEQDPCAA